MLKPGESTRLHLSQVVQEQNGPFSHVIFVRSNDPGRPESRVLIEGMVSRGVAVRPDPLDLGVLEPGESGSDVLEVASDDGAKFAITFINASGPVRARTELGLKMSLHRVDVEYEATRDGFGPIGGSVIVKTDLPDVPPLIIPVRGEVRGAVRVAPGSLMLGSVDSLSSVSRTVMVTHRSSPIEIEDVELVGLGWALEDDTQNHLVRGRTQRIDFRLRVPGLAGFHETELHLRVRSEDSDPVLLRVPVSVVVLERPAHAESQ